MNLVAITGNLVRDVELRFLQSGTAVANFTIANNRKWKDQNGELKEECSFVGIVAFGKSAETVTQYFKKGSPILVSGRLKQERWTDKTTGKETSKTVVVMDAWFFMGGNRSESPNSSAPAPRASAPAAAPAPASNQPDEDDVPF